MARENIGTIDCPHCGRSAFVRRSDSKGGRLYYYCPPSAVGARDGCGLIQGTMGSFQAYMEKHTRYYPRVDLAADASAQESPAGGVRLDEKGTAPKTDAIKAGEQGGGDAAQRESGPPKAAKGAAPKAQSTTAAAARKPGRPEHVSKRGWGFVL